MAAIQTLADTPVSSDPVAAAHREPSRLGRWYRRGGAAAILFALPAILVFAYFSWGPILQGLAMSWQRTNLVTDPEWVGWSNFEYVLQNPVLGQAVLNTLYFMGLSILFGFPLPLFLAVFITELRRGKGLFNVLSYLPVVIPPVVAILLWKTFYDPGPNGTFNQLLAAVGLGPLPWLNDATTAMPSIVLEATWAAAGGTVIIYLAALASVRVELYEAAELDGAGIGSKIWHVTLPQLRGVILVMLLLQIIGTLQIFAEPFLFTGGGPNNATTTVLLLIYNYAFVYGDYGAASALSVMLAGVLCVVSALYFWATRKWSQD